MDIEITKSDLLNPEPEEIVLAEEMTAASAEPVNTEPMDVSDSESADPENIVESTEPVELKSEHPETMGNTEKQIVESSEPANVEPLKSEQNEQEADVVMWEEKKTTPKKKVVIKKKKVVKPRVIKGSAAAITKPKNKQIVKKKVGKPKVPVVLIDLTDEAPKESLQTSVEGKEDEDVNQSQHQVLVHPVDNLSDLKEEKLQGMLKKTGSVQVTFLGHRYEEKKGFIKLELNKADYDEVITTSTVELSNDRVLAAEQMPEIMPGKKNPVLQKVTGDATGEELELASVFVNNIPSDTRPGIMKILFPAARNIQFPTLKDGKSQGYAIFEVPKKFAEDFVKHHEVYRPVIGARVLKLHIVSNQGEKPDAEEVIEIDDEDDEVLMDENIEDSPQCDKGNANTESTSASKTKAKVEEKNKESDQTKQKSTTAVGKNITNTQKSGQENSNTTQKNSQATQKVNKTIQRSPQATQKGKTTQKGRQATQKGRQATQNSQQVTHKSQQATHKSQQATHKSQQATQKNQQATEKSQQVTQKRQQVTQKSQQVTQRSQQATEKNNQTGQRTMKAVQKSQQATKKTINVAQKAKEVINLDDSSPTRESNVEKRPKTSTPVKQSPSSNDGRGASRNSTFKLSERNRGRGLTENKSRFSKGESRTSLQESHSPGRSRWSNLTSEQNTDGGRQSKWQQSKRSSTEQQRSNYRQKLSGPHGVNRRESDSGRLQPSRKGMLGDRPQMGRSLTGLDRPVGMMPATEGQLMAQGGLMPGQSSIGAMMPSQAELMFIGQGMQMAGNAAAGLGGSFPGQRGMMGQENMVSAQGRLMGTQGNIMVGQRNMMTGPGNMMDIQGNMMGGQGNMISGQGNMMIGPGNMMDIQGNMMGGQGNMMNIQRNMTGGQGNMMDIQGSIQDILAQRRNAGLQSGNAVSNQEAFMSQSHQLNPTQGSLLGQPGNMTSSQGSMAMNPQQGLVMMPGGQGTDGGLLPHPGELPTSQAGMTSERPGQRSGLHLTGNRASDSRAQGRREAGMRLSEYVGPGSKFLGSRDDRSDNRPSQNSNNKGAQERITSGNRRRSPNRQNHFSADRNIEQRFESTRTGRRSRFSDLGSDETPEMKSGRGTGHTGSPDFRSRSLNIRSRSPGDQSHSPADFRSRSPRRGDDRNVRELSDFSGNQNEDWRNQNPTRNSKGKRFDRDESGSDRSRQGKEQHFRFDEPGREMQVRDCSSAVGQLGGGGGGWSREREDQRYPVRGGSDSPRPRQDMRAKEEIPDLASIRSQLLRQLHQLETGNLSDTAALADIADKLKKVQQQQKLQEHQQLQQQQQPQQEELYRGRPMVEPVDPSYSQGQHTDTAISRSRPAEHYTLFDRETVEDSKIDRRRFDHGFLERLRSVSPEPERLRFDCSETRQRRKWGDFQPTKDSTQASMVTFDYGHQKVLGAEFSKLTARTGRESRQARPRDDQDYPDRDIDDRTFGEMDFTPSYCTVTSSKAYDRRDDTNNTKAIGLLGDAPRREVPRSRQRVGMSGVDEVHGNAGYTSTEPDRRRGFQENVVGQSQGLIGQSQRLMGQPQRLMGQSQGLLGQSPALGQSQGLISSKTGNTVPLMSLPRGNSVGGRRGKQGTPKIHTRKVSVANLPPSASWKQITSFFNNQMSNRGLADPVSVRNPVAGVVQSRVNSSAFVIFNSEEEAEKAVSHLNGISYDKHVLRLELLA